MREVTALIEMLMFMKACAKLCILDIECKKLENEENNIKKSGLFCYASELNQDSLHLKNNNNNKANIIKKRKG